MKLYKIEFKEHGWDMYDSFIVSAKNKDGVITLIRKDIWKSDACDWESGYTIKEIGEYKYKASKIILGSFNAG